MSDPLPIRDSDLERRFRRCLVYQSATPAMKPFLNPARFLRNQVRRRFHPLSPGTLSRTDAFHWRNLTVVEGECVSEAIISYGIYEPALTQAFLKLVKPGQVVVDVGMHLGYFTTLFAVRVGSKGAVHAFEPTPSTREIALHNTRRCPQVQVHPYALWSSSQELTFQDFGLQWMAFNSLGRPRLDGIQATPKTYQVQTTTLDQFRQSLSRTVALVKIDAESAELEILKGAETLISKDRPILTLEVGDAPEGSTQSRELVSWLSARGYRAWEWRDGGFRRHEVRDTYVYDNLVFAPEAQELEGS
jgi:FkbM family methyltransferase